MRKACCMLKGENMKKIFYLTNFEAPYRVPFYELLAQHFDLTLVAFESALDNPDRNKSWFYKGKRNYKLIYLKPKKIGKVKIAFDAIKYLKKCDLVFMDMYSPPTHVMLNFFIKFSRKKLVLSVDGMLKHANEHILLRLLKRCILKTPICILSPSEYVDECLYQYGVKKEKIVRYHFTSLTDNDIMPTVMPLQEKEVLRKKLGLPHEKIILSVGNFIPRKGFDVLIKAFENLPPNYHLCIVGGEPAEEYTKLKKEMHLDNVHFFGFKSKEELSEYYKAADLFVLPTREDVWGLVINEAMGKALPVITTDRCVAGLDLVKNNENGFVVPVGDKAAIADSIDYILSDNSIVKKMSEKSLRRIREYTVENMANRHVEVFKQLLSANDFN